MRDYFKTTLSKDFLDIFLGQQIGFGCFREVYECNTDPSVVIKVEYKSVSFNNIFEWDTWQKLRYTVHHKWLSPCRFISPCGRILIQDKTEPVSYKELPKFLPVFLTDIKKENFGMLDGKIVCHDYGSNLILENGLSNKVRRVEWR